MSRFRMVADWPVTTHTTGPPASGLPLATSYAKQPMNRSSKIACSVGFRWVAMLATKFQGQPQSLQKGSFTVLADQ